MTPEEVKQLLARFERGECSMEEEDLLMAWASKQENSRSIDWTAAEQKRFMDRQSAEILQATCISVTGDRTRILHRGRWVRYAAAAIILLLLGAATYWWVRRDIPGRMLANDKRQLQIVPGGNKALLTLADGSTIVLDNSGNGLLAKQGGTEVIKTANGQISYSLRGLAKEDIFMNTMTTPRGGKYQLVLPDGSRVWLNAASSITYPAAFAGNERTVSASGEVYFEIAKDKVKPFLVDIDGISTVEVLGTHFNINAYRDEGYIKTTLLEGSIRIKKQRQSVLLTPGQQAVIPATIAPASITVTNNADLEEAVAWKNGYFQFNETSLSQVMKQLERWYDVEVVYEGIIPGKTFIGEIPLDASLSQVLKVLEKTRVHFRIEGRKIIVMS